MNNRIAGISPDETTYTNELKLKVAKALKRVMFDYQISGKNLANMSGFNATYISHLRSGKNLPDFKNFMILVESLPDDARKYFLDLLFGTNSFKVAEKK